MERKELGMKFRGSLVALVTPFSSQDRVDEGALKRLVEFHVTGGTTGLVPCGTTGESATLSTQEHEHVIETVVQAARGRIPVIAGTGSNNTKEAVSLTVHAKRVGADAALLIAPYYNRPTQRGLYLHFKAVADAVDLPLILYNIASRTAVNIEPDTMAKLVADCRNIVAVKEASGNLEQMSRILQLTNRRLTLLSGDDALTLPVLAIGGTGVISVVANLVPGDVAAMIVAYEHGKPDEAIRWHDTLSPLVKAMFIETNPIPVKTAMGILGMIEPGLRLPLCAMEGANLERLRAALDAYGLQSRREISTRASRVTRTGAPRRTAGERGMGGQSGGPIRSLPPPRTAVGWRAAGPAKPSAR